MLKRALKPSDVRLPPTSTGLVDGALLRLAKQSCCHIPHVSLLEDVVLAIILVYAKVQESFHNSINLEAHDCEAVNEASVVASVPESCISITNLQAVVVVLYLASSIRCGVAAC